jgi:hypothetical protein
MTDKRDYRANGLGRRDYDNYFAAHCLSCDLRKEVKTKLSWRHYIMITGGILAILGTVLGVGAKVATTGVVRMLDTQKETLNAVHKVSERASRIETRQEAIMKELDIGQGRPANIWGTIEENELDAFR